MSEAMDIDVAELRAAAARIAGQHDPIVRQAERLEAFAAGPATSGRDYAAAGQRYASTMRGTVAQSIQEFAAEVRAVASTVSATVNDYAATENANTRRLTP